MHTMNHFKTAVKPACRSPLGRPAAMRPSQQQRGPRLLRAASPDWAMDGLSGDQESSMFSFFDQQDMSLLSQRIELLRKSLVVLPSEDEVEAARATIPELPQGGLILDDMLDDHRLICDWHEQQWKRFGAMSADDHY